MSTDLEALGRDHAAALAAGDWPALEDCVSRAMEAGIRDPGLWGSYAKARLGQGDGPGALRSLARVLPPAPGRHRRIVELVAPGALDGVRVEQPERRLPVSEGPWTPLMARRQPDFDRAPALWRGCFDEALVTPSGLVVAGGRCPAEGLSFYPLSGRAGESGYGEFLLEAGGRAVFETDEVPRRLDGPHVLMASGAAGDWNNYYHFLIDLMPRLLMGLEDPDFRDLPVIGGPIGRLQSRVLDAAGLGGLQFVEAHGATLSVDRLRVRSMASTTGLAFSEGLEALRARFLPGDAGGRKRRLWISRRDSPNRPLVDEPAIEGALAERGFDIVTPGKLDFAEQVALFASAEVVAGANGAGLANLAFAPPGTRVVEVMTKLHPAYPRFAAALGFDYDAVAAEPAGGEGDPERASYRVSVAEVLRRL